MKRLLVLVGVAVVVPGATLGALLATRSSGSNSATYRGSQPPPGLRAPDFALRSYRGPVVRMRDLGGKVVLVAFLDTACIDKCPIIAAEIGAAITLLTPTERIDMEALAITVLPKVDTPSRVRTFLQQRHAVGKLDWLIGPADALPEVWKRFAVLPAADTGDANVHSAGVRVFDRMGIWVSTLHAGVDLTPGNLVHDIWVALRTARPEKGTS